MALLQLKDIGKIYVSDSTVAVGIRGVNLSFDRGEFVAITGQSGSGKSTLLNVISGMDSYEEGELYIEGEQTSHYTQADWEKYREKYISFIFQEYNIIDSFTVLENVELSLMHITNPKLRRERAMELIRRVGLENHARHKGSHLSGGQKQRTVIARALAKDSPIILADEPTGNLDSETSKEIIALLKEVSKDKLLIVVTHNFDEVAEHATREIRVFDHAVASDREIVTKNAAEGEIADTTDAKHNTVRNSLALGLIMFKSKPRLSLFMCVLVLLAGAGLFMLFGSFWEEIKPIIYDQHYMFAKNPGRVIIVKNDGSVMTDEELSEVALKTGAVDTVRIDYAMDLFMDDYYWENFTQNYAEINYLNERITLNVRYDLDNVKPDVGRLPQQKDEVLIRVPYYMRSVFGTDTVKIPETTYDRVIKLKIVGVDYYYDKDAKGAFYMTKEGLLEFSSLVLNMKYGRTDNISGLYAASDETEYFSYYAVIAEGIPVIGDENVASNRPVFYTGEDAAVPEKLTICGYSDSKSDESGAPLKEWTGVTIDMDDCDVVYGGTKSLHVNADLVSEWVEERLHLTYRQASLFYSSDAKAKKQIDVLQDMGYMAALSSDVYKVNNQFEIIEILIMGVVYGIMWAFILTFIALFLQICTKKSMDAFKPDIAIMRSMGIRVTEIKAAIRIRMIMCMLPAVIIIPIAATILYRTEWGGKNLSYARLPEYIIIYILLFVIVNKVSKIHVKRLFSENVRKALKGGEE
ncbi:MAG: ABC transporter ATP-binding protein [Lachnospiraceae bacterium]|nr:ABC transporter ATP-binding protein [Lachnospiraceae bacterium]